jgi:hypothetical protein
MSDIKERFMKSHQDDLAFHPRWVMPFYLDFGGVFFEKSDEALAGLAHKAHVALKEINDETFLKMLNHKNWRPRQSAGWLIALGRKSQFVPQISETLLNHPQYAMMFCFALYRIGGTKSINGLSAYLNQYLKPNIAEDIFLTEGLSINHALVVLERLDATKEQFRIYFPDRWNEFVKTYQKKRRWSDEVVSNIWNLENTESSIAGWVAFADKYFP